MKKTEQQTPLETEDPNKKVFRVTARLLARRLGVRQVRQHNSKHPLTVPKSVPPCKLMRNELVFTTIHLPLRKSPAVEANGVSDEEKKRTRRVRFSKIEKIDLVGFNPQRTTLPRIEPADAVLSIVPLTSPLQTALEV